MSPEQSRHARAMLAWSQEDLAEAALVPVEVAAAFERCELHGLFDLEVAMRCAMEAAGVGFPEVADDAGRAPDLVAYRPSPGRDARPAAPRAGASSRWRAIRSRIKSAIGVDVWRRD